VVSFTPLPLNPRERAPGTHWIGGWLGPRAGLDDVENRKFLTLTGLELQPLGHPAHSQSLYQLHYLSSVENIYTNIPKIGTMNVITNILKIKSSIGEIIQTEKYTY
jgi:hypothetical protein